MTTLWLLVHSPLLGPSSLEPLAKVLTADVERSLCPI